MSNSGPVIDTYQVHDIVARNAFGLGPVYFRGHQRDEDVNKASTGLRILASYMNHSCVSNTKNLGDLMVLRATRPIPSSKDITHSYDETSDYDESSAVLMKTWDFKCNCALCIAEEADSPALRNKRRELESEANALTDREEAARAKRVYILKVQRLSRSINDTYDDERYKRLHRMTLFRIQKWLADSTTR
jgi:hypothetical protein